MNERKFAGFMRTEEQSMNLDMALAIDCSGDMTKFLEGLKRRINTLCDELTAQLQKKRYRINRLRVKVIAFRDYYYADASSSHPPMQISPFFELPAQNEELTEFVRSLEACGGGDIEENGLEALHYAFCSEWDTRRDAMKNRQLIALFTNAAAHPLNDCRRYDAQYPEEQMPSSLWALYEEYISEQRCPARERRLLLIAPQYAYPWDQISAEWEMTMLSPMEDKALSMDIGILYEMLG